MKLKAIRIKNFKALKDVMLSDIPNFAVFLGANGSGKSTFFEVFGFLKDAFNTDVHTALLNHGGSFDEVRSRDSKGDIEINMFFSMKNAKIKGEEKASILYFLQIGKNAQGRGIVKKEMLGNVVESSEARARFLSFKKGKGMVFTVPNTKSADFEKEMSAEKYTLKSPDILAIKGLAQFDKFPEALDLGKFIDGWHLSDIHISKARESGKTIPSEHLSVNGDNLFGVIDYYHKNYPEVLKEINAALKNRIPGVADVETQTSKTGEIILKIRDELFKKPFLIDHVSHGTVKMLAYLALLYDPKPHKLLCVEEPENQLYHTLLEELAEEFRYYAHRGRQVFVSTHSPDFLNAAELEEVFWLVKKDGYTTITPASKDKQVRRYMENGDKMGRLWKQNFFRGVGP